MKRGPSRPQALFIPSIADDTKRLRAAAWILVTECGYPATKLRSATHTGGLRKESTIPDKTIDATTREQGDRFIPKFDAQGLLTAVIQDAASNEILMVAFMDSEALAKTRETGFAHFHSRSRARLWMKGETSGHVLRVRQVFVDCDQDAIVIKAEPAGPACHTGARSCFYRELQGDALVRTQG